METSDEASNAVANVNKNVPSLLFNGHIKPLNARFNVGIKRIKLESMCGEAHVTEARVLATLVEADEGGLVHLLDL